MEKVSKIQIGCSKYDIQDNEARQLIEELKNSGILNDIDIDATVDSNTGTPHVFVEKGENSFTLNFTGLKGETGPKGDKGDRGDRGEQGPAGNDGRDGRDGTIGHDGAPGITPSLRATAAIGNTVGTPNVEVRRSGTDANPVFEFIFNGLRGKDGSDGRDGRDGRDGHDGIDGVAQITDEIIENIKNRVIEAIGQLDTEIQQKVEDIVNEADWWQNHIPEGVIGSDSNFGEQNVQEYLQRIGLWFTSDGDTYTKWSTIRQTYDGIYNDVNQLKASQSTGGTVDYEALAGSLYTYITGETITSGVQATWAHFLGLGDDTIQMLEWMASGMRAQANSEQAVAGLFAAAAEHSDALTIANAAMAGVNAIVEKDANGNYVAKSSLVSTIASQVEGQLQPVSTAGLATEAYVNSAVASLFADNGTGRAYVTTYVDDALSNVTISADDINLNGRTWADVINLGTLLTNAFYSGGMFDNNYHTVIDQEGVTVSSAGNKSGNKTNVSSSGISFYQSSTYGSLSGSIGATGLSLPGVTYSVVDVSGTNNTFNVAGTVKAGVFKSTDYKSDGILTISAEGNLNLRGSDISIGDSQTETITASRTITTGSDENLKDIVCDTTVAVENIASTRTVDYRFKSDENHIYTGAIAQDWQSILPNAVKSIDNEGHLGLDYSSAALVSAVVDAREIVKLKQENEELKQRLAAIEARLANI